MQAIQKSARTDRNGEPLMRNCASSVPKQAHQDLNQTTQGGESTTDAVSSLNSTAIQTTQRKERKKRSKSDADANTTQRLKAEGRR